MGVFLQAMMAYVAMDVISILQKKRKTIEAFQIEATAQQAEEFPHVFMHVYPVHILKSIDATLQDLEGSIELSQKKYYSTSAMFCCSGFEITWQAKLV